LTAPYRYVLGLDLGPPGEPTGFAVLEEPAVEVHSLEPTYNLRHLERFPPGATYPAIVAAVAARAGTSPLYRSPLVVDQTAVGKGVIDRLRRAQPAPWVVPVVIGAGQAVQQDERGGWLVPKKELVTCLQLVLQARRLKVAPELPDAELLVTELAGFRLRRVSLGDTEAAEWRAGRQDDLVFAVALACWYADRHRPLGPGAISVGVSEIARLMFGGMEF
jgi:hypothetical protein